LWGYARTAGERKPLFAKMFRAGFVEDREVTEESDYNVIFDAVGNAIEVR
jgi:predicted DsbA family dithiol-disulfide isomerase